jgi:hypothetical protein
VGVYHLQLRQFPHNANSFNVGESELFALLYPWVAERAIELGERKWSPHQATLTVIEGPHLPVESLSMGRGWRTAEREGTDVTEQVLAQARQQLAAAQTQHAPSAAPAASAVSGTPAGAPGGPAVAADPLAAGVELAALLGPDAGGLLAAWRRIAGRAPGLTPSESLALAERELGEAPDGR